MPILEESLRHVEFPSWRRVRQHFQSPPAIPIAETIARTMMSPETGGMITPGMRVAVAVGSRGIRCIQPVVRAVVRELKARGAHVFIVPAMGSHGGATAEGQRDLLAGYGITEDGVGAPVRASMDTVQVGTLDDGLPVYQDRVATIEADAVIPVARVKPHTDFRGPVESGLFKMLAIGLGKHRGCSLLHARGLDTFGDLIPRVGRFILGRTKVPFGIAIVENAWDQPAILAAIPRSQLYEREQELLGLARRYMARILPPDFDILVVQEIGKDISGAGMDPNITGRSTFPVPPIPGLCRYQRLVVLGLTEATHGNGAGIGVADITTRACAATIDLEKTYTNHVAAAALAGCRLPLMAADDREALTVAVRTCLRSDQNRPRILWIRNTLELEDVRMTEPLWEQVCNLPGLEPAGEPEPIRLDSENRLIM